MGYTHYWRRPKEIEAIVFKAIVDDFKQLLPTFAELNVPLAGPLGTGEPRITYDSVDFNGSENCGHEPTMQLCIPWPTEDAGGLFAGDPVVGEWFAGSLVSTRACPGDCSYESFNFPRVLTIGSWQELDDRGLYFDCCKTAFRPYDLAVTAFLIIAKYHMGDSLRVTSDGEMQHWFDAVYLTHIHLGYGLDFRLDE